MSWIYVNIFRMTCVKLRIRLENFKGVFARLSMTSDRLSFTSVEIDKVSIDSTPVEKFVSQMIT